MPVIKSLDNIQRLDKDDKANCFATDHQYAAWLVLKKTNQRIHRTQPLRDQQEAQLMQYQLPPEVYRRKLQLTKLNSALGRLPLGMTMFKATHEQAAHRAADQQTLIEACAAEAVVLNDIVNEYRGELFTVFRSDSASQRSAAFVAPLRGIHIHPGTTAQPPTPYLAIETYSGVVGEAPRQIVEAQLWEAAP